ncbi:MAG: lamin tail domain-containing protein, partial [Myxococcales bacterium]|nr:lamin tail domain-containing protein [Myxococcales bacterium]
MKRIIKKTALSVACVTAGIAGCAEPTELANDVQTPFEDLQLTGGKADQVANARLIDDIDLDSMIQGKFDRRVRVYGFTFEAKAGAQVKVDLRTKAGSDSLDAQSGQALDTVAAIYGPIVGDSKGRKLAASDDTDEGVEANLPELTVPQDGKYLVIFSTWNDPGAGEYEVEVACSGTNFQCMRPVQQGVCLPGTQYIQGQTVVGDETWARCNVVLLENTIVEEGATLTINPGVTVKGNFLGEGSYGQVGLQVDGTLQAVGTESHPVVFTALRDGWKGLTLNGDHNTLQTAFVEKAAVGVEVKGSHNRFEHLDINTGALGMRFNADSLENTLRHVRIEAVESGIDQRGNAQLDGEDVILIGKGADQGTGLDAEATGLSRIDGAIITGFRTGLHFDNAEYEFEDTTVAGNGTGVSVTGPDGGVHPQFECPAMPAATTPSRPRPSIPQPWPRDPKFVNCDIVNNADEGVHISAPQLVVIERSNIEGNGAGVVIEADSLHQESRINANNILGNGDTWQVDTWHINGTLDISGNFWNRISDPELSSSWRTEHSVANACRTVRSNMNGCTWRSPNYICGPYTCTRGAGNDWNCSAPNVTTAWEGEVSFTGFAPERLDVGVNLEGLSNDISKIRGDLGLDAAPVVVTEPTAAGTLIINEIDYDQPGADDGEFIELYNPGASAVQLAGFAVELVNGSNGEVYHRVPLSTGVQGPNSGFLQAGGYLVIGREKVLDALSADVLRVALTHSIQNGSPDG